jgi:tRNA pseudouridine38-40 synthase
MPRFALIIEYDGSSYFGWQRQPGAPTIQEAIEEALAHIVRQPVVLHGSGRTDSGVHATGQCAHFDAETGLAPAVLEKALNSLLPQDIVIRTCLGGSWPPPEHRSTSSARETGLLKACWRALSIKSL